MSENNIVKFKGSYDPLRDTELLEEEKQKIRGELTRVFGSVDQMDTIGLFKYFGFEKVESLPPDVKQGLKDLLDNNGGAVHGLRSARELEQENWSEKNGLVANGDFSVIYPFSINQVYKSVNYSRIERTPEGSRVIEGRADLPIAGLVSVLVYYEAQKRIAASRGKILALPSKTPEAPE